MAWRVAGKKGICNARLGNVLTSAVPGVSLVSRSFFKDAIRSFLASQGWMPASLDKLQLPGAQSNKVLTRRPLIRYFRASQQLLANRIDDSFGLKTAKKEKYYARKDSKTQLPVEPPYVPPKMTRSIKPSQDRAIDIFEGMTLVELAKRTGESIR